jgi:hypothetical protein
MRTGICLHESHPPHLVPPNIGSIPVAFDARPHNPSIGRDAGIRDENRCERVSLLRKAYTFGKAYIAYLH